MRAAIFLWKWPELKKELSCKDDGPISSLLNCTSGSQSENAPVQQTSKEMG